MSMSIDIVPLKPDLFAIRAHGRRWLKVFPFNLGRTFVSGWRPVVWTNDFTEAEKFETRLAAETFARANVTGFRQNSQLTSTAATA